ncbi:MAG TPA: CRISPR-associated endonuclease Cas3'', partial [Paenibacillaceae bacterium]|nr:CRISPR-associated endonuclease Cas3'' [Paenibacillaceae bacterium]
MEEILISHDKPIQSLKCHLEGVYELNQFYLKEIQQNLKDDDVFKSLVSILSLFHDFGKSTEYFQKYITSEKDSKDKKKNHALLSSILTYFITDHFLKQKGGEFLFLPFFLFVIVRRHHGNLNNIEIESIKFTDEERKRLHIQIDALILDGFLNQLSNLLSYLPEEVQILFPLTKEQLHAWIDEFEIELSKIRRSWTRYVRQKSKNQNDLSDYLLICLLYSLLLDGDKNQAALRKTDVLQKRRDLPYVAVDQYKRKQNWDNTGQMNKLREKAYQEINEKVLTIHGSLFSITLPTGMGKTLA